MLEEIESLVSLENIEKHKRYRLNKGKPVCHFFIPLSSMYVCYTRYLHCGKYVIFFLAIFSLHVPMALYGNLELSASVSIISLRR